MNTNQIAVLDGTALEMVLAQMQRAQQNGQKVRLHIISGEGIKMDAGGGWTLPYGRTADETGH
jgi:hypothetical protein